MGKICLVLVFGSRHASRNQLSMSAEVPLRVRLVQQRQQRRSISLSSCEFFQMRAETILQTVLIHEHPQSARQYAVQGHRPMKYFPV